MSIERAKGTVMVTPPIPRMDSDTVPAKYSTYIKGDVIDQKKFADALITLVSEKAFYKGEIDRILKRWNETERSASMGRREGCSYRPNDERLKNINTFEREYDAIVAGINAHKISKIAMEFKRAGGTSPYADKIYLTTHRYWPMPRDLGASSKKDLELTPGYGSR